MGLLDRIVKRSDEPRLAQLLKAYPPYEAPFPGPPRSLTLDQAMANLAYLLDHRAERIAALAALLQEFAIDLESGMAAEDPAPFLRALHDWAKAEWPAVHDPKLARREVWIATTRKGPEIVYSMLMDVAIVLGEIVVARRPQFAWSIDLDPVNDRDWMDTFLRPVVQKPAGDTLPAPIVLDYEAIVVGCFRNARSPGFRISNDLGRSVTDALSGAYEAPFAAKAEGT